MDDDVRRRLLFMAEDEVYLYEDWEGIWSYLSWKRERNSLNNADDRRLRGWAKKRLLSLIVCTLAGANLEGRMPTTFRFTNGMSPERVVEIVAERSPAGPSVAGPSGAGPSVAGPSGVSRVRAKPRTRSYCTLWSLPEEMMVQLLSYLPITDLLKVACVSSYFADLVKDNRILWKHVSFINKWPSLANKRIFLRAVDHGNFEADLKLGIAYLYNQGFEGDASGTMIVDNGRFAAEHFLRVERSHNYRPFVWFLIRAPWSKTTCCKEVVFNSFQERAQENVDSNALLCIARVLMLQESPHAENVLKLVSKEKAHGSLEAAFMEWHMTSHIAEPHVKDKVQRLREMLQIGSHGPVQLELARHYCRGHYGGLSEADAMGFVRQLTAQARPSNMHTTLSKGSITTSMRYIVMDWLVEVSHMKEFDTRTLHMCLDMVDRFLHCRTIGQTQLQLLGVVCLLICSRYCEVEIMTIYEACWLTDSTYRYFEVVHMIGEILSALRGNLWMVNALDYLQLYCFAFNTVNSQLKYLAEYICELAVLQADLTVHSPAEIAASSFMLALLSLNMAGPEIWPCQLELFSGFSLENLKKCTLHLHEKCFPAEPTLDQGNAKLQAVTNRYLVEARGKVSNIKIVGVELLRRRLMVTLGGRRKDSRLRCKSMAYLIMSPSRSHSPGKNRGKGKQPKRKVAQVEETSGEAKKENSSPDRDLAPTPTLEHQPQHDRLAEPKDMEDYLDMSGYEADISFQEVEDEPTRPARSRSRLADSVKRDSVSPDLSTCASARLRVSPSDGSSPVLPQRTRSASHRASSRSASSSKATASSTSSSKATASSACTSSGAHDPAPKASLRSADKAESNPDVPPAGPSVDDAGLPAISTTRSGKNWKSAKCNLTPKCAIALAVLKDDQPSSSKPAGTPAFRPGNSTTSRALQPVIPGELQDRPHAMKRGRNPVNPFQLESGPHANNAEYQAGKRRRGN